MCGMTEKEFRHSTIKEINIRLKKYKEENEYKVKELEYHSWLTGLYVKNAIASCFDKKVKYPKNPIEEKEAVQDMEFTEAQADFYRNQFLKRLQRMEAKFNTAKKKSDKGEE